jgi:hypothetical protein
MRNANPDADPSCPPSHEIPVAMPTSGVNPIALRLMLSDHFAMWWAIELRKIPCAEA